jgi:hypothetical protein
MFMFIVLTHLKHNGIQMEEGSIVITNGIAATPDGSVLLMECCRNMS